MNILILYFTGTGNTAWLTRKLAGEFSGRGHHCTYIPLEEILHGKTTPIWDDYELFGFGYPIHAMDAPRIVYELLPLLPSGRHNCFLYKNAGSGFALGGSTRRLRLALAQRGWIVKHESFFTMPANMLIPPSPEKIRMFLDKALEAIPVTVSQILNEDRVLLPDTGLMRFASLLNRSECHGLPKISKCWIASSACIRCGKCVKQCPTGNISLTEDGLEFSDKCVLCLRCWWNCPTRALENTKFKYFQLKEPYSLPDEE